MSELPPTVDNDPLKLVFVDESHDALEAARDAADERLTDELNQGNRFNKFLKGIWKGNIARDYYRQRYIREATKDIQDSQDVLIYQKPLDEAARTEALVETIDRFQGPYDELIHQDAGERRAYQQQDSDLSQGMKGLIRQFCNGELDEDALREERGKVLTAYREAHPEADLARGLVTVDNMIDVARTVVSRVQHGADLEATIATMQIITGEARNGVRTEAHYTKVDKVIDKLASTRVGSLVQPEILATSVTIAASLARWGSHSVVGAVTKTVLPGVAAGAWAGLRENRRVKDERTQHAREMAQGKEFAPGAKRRDEMEATRYESASALDLEGELRDHLDQERLESGHEAVQAALDALAQVEARIRVSDQKHIDLISYSDATKVGHERTALDIARAEVKRALDTHLTADVRQQLNLNTDEPLGSIIDHQVNTYIDASIETDISEKDRVFKKLRNRRVRNAAITGAAIGIAGGLLTQEVIAAIDPTRFGLLDQITGAHAVLVNGEQHQTVLEGLVNGDHSTIHTGASHEYAAHSFGKNSTIELSNDQHIVDNKNGTISLLDPNGHASVENLKVDSNGNLPPESLKELRAAGMNVQDHSFNQAVNVTETHNVSADQYVNNHIGEATHVTRDLWYDDNTPNTFEKNELGLHWNGNAGISDHGYEMSVSTMTPDGSYDGSQSVEWQQAAESGHLKLAVSATEGSQAKVFMVDIDAKGQVHIPANSPAGHFFKSVDGHAVFTGAYAEAVQVTGVDPKTGLTHIRPLATLVGDRSQTSVMDTVTTTHTEHHALYTITSDGYNTEVPTFTEAAPVTPIVSRRSMETVSSNGEALEGGYYGNYYRAKYMSAEELKQRREDTSPRLLRDSGEKLQTGRELGWYRKHLKEVTSKEYLKEIDKQIDASPELTAPNPNLKAVVTIPVGAVGEADNIYKTLSLYAQQDAESLASTKILLHVNWLDSAEANPAKAEAIAKTKAEIERARADFPQLTIATMQTVWEQAKLDAGEYGRGLIGNVARRMYDAALIAVERQIADGTLAGDKDVLLIRNDADAQGMDRRYLSRMISTAEARPEKDVFTGAVRWETARHSDMPGLAFVANLQSTMQLAALKRSVKEWPQTVGINTAVRMSTLAAVGCIGHDPVDTGAGSDDLAIGGRINDVRSGDLVYGRGASRRFYEVGRLRQRQRYNGASSAEAHSSKYDYQMLVAGTGIDTKADRIERSYLTNGVAKAWDEFDAGGYSSRSAGLESLPRKENIVSDAPAIIKRIESNLSGIVRNSSPAQLSAGLAMMLPEEVKGKRMYNINRANGAAEFSFTSDGATWLIQHLRRNGRGQFDPIGSRVRRQLYNEANGKLQPVSVVPRFVS